MKKESPWLLVLIGLTTLPPSSGLALSLYHDGSASSSATMSSEVSRRGAFQRTAGAAVSASGLILPPSSPAGAETVSLKVPKVKLGGSNLEVSRTIQGYWQLAGGHGKFRESDVIKNMKAHFDAGITTLDTADIYGSSEYVR